MGVRRPVRADVDSMLRSLFQIEEHPASKDAEKGWTSKGGENASKDPAKASDIIARDCKR